VNVDIANHQMNFEFLCFFKVAAHYEESNSQSMNQFFCLLGAYES